LTTDWLTFPNFGQSEKYCKKQKSSSRRGPRHQHAPPPPRLRRARETRALPGSISFGRR